MGETDYKDESWTEKDLQELQEAGREGERRAKLYRENPEQWKRERDQREAEATKK